MSKETKDPTPELRALHVSLGGRNIVKIKPDGDKITIGDKTWTLDHSCLAPGEGKWDVMLIDGQGQAVSFNADHENPSPEEWDAACHNNLLKQIHDLSSTPKTPGLSWLQLGILGLVVLCVIGAGVKNSNDAKAIKASIIDLQAHLQANGNYNGQDATQYNPHPTPTGGT